MKKIITTSLLAFSTLIGLAQTPAHRTCGTLDNHNYLMQTRKNYAQDFVQYNQMLDQYIQNNQSALNIAAKTSNITIPVVIHILYNTAAQNISDAQATSQFAVLNNDFQGLNTDRINTPSTFTNVLGSAGITFCLAQRDPSGNPTTGIIHKSTTTTSFTTDNKIKSSATGGDDAWDVTKYVNIWVGNISGGILGYGEFPTGTLSNTYGLVLNYVCTGVTATGAPYNLGRTGTHEFGHCFNLAHIWGDEAACAADDGLTDTPQQKDKNFGVPTFPQGTAAAGGCCSAASVSSMYMNYMDYTDDAAMYMFTQQQCARMLAVVSTAPWNVLASSNGCTPASALDAGISSILNPVNGLSTCNNAVTPKTILTNAGSTTLTSAKVMYKMDATATQTLNWTGSLATGATATLTLNAYTGLSNSAHTFSVWVTSPNGGVDGGPLNDSQVSTFTVATPAAGAALPFVEGFEAATFPPTGWLLQKANTISATNTWSRLANTTGLTAGSTGIAKMDNYSGATNIAGQLDALRSPALTFTAATSALNLSFDVSHRIYSATYIDSLNVYLSSDCGVTWNRLYTKGGTQLANAVTTQTSAYTPTVNTQWRRESISLAAYAGLPSVYVKFESRSGYGNNVYIDNINISSTTASTTPVASFSASVTKCAGSAVSFTDLSTNTPTSWAWSFPGGSPSTSTLQNPSVTYTASGTYSVTLSSANSSGTSTAVTQTISISALPLVLSNSKTSCVGAVKTLTATGASTYLWSTGATTSVVTVAPLVTTAYTVIGTAATGCTNSAIGTITVASLPVVASTSSSICIGNTATLTASGANTYSWTTGAATASIVMTPTTTSSYTVTGTATLTGCKNTAIGTITVNTLPTVVVSSATICAGSTGTLVASGASTYSWNTGATGPNLVASPIVLTNYTVNGTSAAGCSNTATASISVGLAPSIALNSATVCAGVTATLSASGVSTYTWNTGSNSASIAVTPTITTTYSVSGNLAGCAVAASKTATVTVNLLPIVASNSKTGCLGAVKTLTATGASTYLWSTGAVTPVISVIPLTTTSYTVVGTAVNGCTNSAVGTVTVFSLPVVASTSSSICIGGNSILTASGASTYSWSSGAATSTIAVTPTTTTSYTVTGTATVTGCKNTAVGTVTVNNLPTVSATSATICSGDIATLTASGASTYSWNTGAVTANLTASPLSLTNYTVTGTSAAGCSNTALASITVGSAPIISVNSSTICAGSTATLAASGLTTYTWSTSSNAPSITVSPAANTTYTISGNLTGCTSVASKTVSVKVNSLPTVSLGSISILCLNSSAVSLVGSPSGGTYSGTGVSAAMFDPAVSGAGTFNVTYNYTDINNCSNSAVQSATVSLCTAITEAFSGSEISIYPNPANDILHVNLSNGFSENTVIELYDAIGKLVMSEKAIDSMSTLSISHLAKGIYSIRVLVDSHQVVKRIIKD